MRPIHNLFSKFKAMRARKAEAARRVALEPLQKAIQARDTRKQHETWPDAFRATCKALRTEVGR